jgi:hypothetical protein
VRQPIEGVFAPNGVREKTSRFEQTPLISPDATSCGLIRGFPFCSNQHGHEAPEPGRTKFQQAIIFLRLLPFVPI